MILAEISRVMSKDRFPPRGPHTESVAMLLLSLNHGHCGLGGYCLRNPPTFPQKPGLRAFDWHLSKADREGDMFKKGINEDLNGKSPDHE